MHTVVFERKKSKVLFSRASQARPKLKALGGVPFATIARFEFGSCEDTYPSHCLPVLVQRAQLGLASSHLTRRILRDCQLAPRRRHQAIRLSEIVGTHLQVMHPLRTFGAYLRCGARCSPISFLVTDWLYAWKFTHQPRPGRVCEQLRTCLYTK